MNYKRKDLLKLPERGGREMKKIIKWFRGLWHELTLSWDDICPNCGYYCTGKSVFCTKGL